MMALDNYKSMVNDLSNILVTRVQNLPADAKLLLNWFQSLPTLQRWIVGITAFNTTILITHRLFSYLSRKIHKYPPGLYGIPYFGSFFTFGFYGEEKFTQSLLPSYGPITMHKIGITNILTINEVNLIKVIIGSEYCALRPWQLTAIYTNVDKSNYNDDLTSNALKIHQIVPPQAFSNDYQSQRRRLALNAVSKIANRKFVESQVNVLLSKQMYPVLEKMAIESGGNNHNERKKASWSPHRDMDLISFNITFGALFGIDNILSKDNKDFLTIADHSTEFGVLFGLSILSNFFYFPRIIRKHYIDDKITVGFVKNLSNSSVIFEKYIDNAIKEYENKKSSVSDDDSSFTLFDEIYQSIKNDKNMNSIITDEILLADIFSLLAAATDTTTATLESCLLFAAKYASVQEEVYQELKQFSNGDGDGDGASGDIEYKNITQCVKFQGFIHEVLRISAIVPKNTARAVSEACILKFNYETDNNGYKKSDAVNSKSIIFDKLSNYERYNNEKGQRDCEYIIDESFYIDSNLDYVMTQDSNIWGLNPSKLDINHWIKQNSEKGEIFFKNTNSLPFSIGKRDCPGRMLAMKAIKLIMAKLFLKYKFTFEDDSIDITYEYGFVKQINPKRSLVVEKRT